MDKGAVMPHGKRSNRVCRSMSGRNDGGIDAKRYALRRVALREGLSRRACAGFGIDQRGHNGRVSAIALPRSKTPTPVYDAHVSRLTRRYV
jgi:hypothetical protein